MGKIIVEDLTKPNQTQAVEALGNEIYLNAVFDGGKLRLTPKDILKALMIAARGAAGYMETVDLISKEEMEQINDEVTEIVEKQSQNLESTGLIDSLKKASKEDKDGG